MFLEDKNHHHIFLHKRADEEEDDYNPGRRTSLPAYGMETGPPPSHTNRRYQDQDYYDDEEPQRTTTSVTGYTPYSKNGYLEEGMEEDDQLDDSTRYVLGRARTARGGPNRPAWQMEEVEQAKKRSGITTRWVADWKKLLFL